MRYVLRKRSRDAPAEGRQRTLSSLLLQFALSGLAAVAVVGVAGTLVIRHAGLNESIRDAREVTELLGHAVVEPNLTDGIVRGDPRAIARLDRLRPRVIRGSAALAGILWQTGGIVPLFAARIAIAVVAEVAALRVFGDVHRLRGRTHRPAPQTAPSLEV